MDKWTVFIDDCDACVGVFDSYDEAEKYYNLLKIESNDIPIYFCRVIREDITKMTKERFR